MEVQGNLQSLLDGYNRINAGIEERSKTLQSYVSQQREIAAKVKESIEFLNKIQIRCFRRLVRGIRRFHRLVLGIQMNQFAHFMSIRALWTQ